MTSIFRSIVHSSFRRSIQIGSFVQQILNNTWVFLTGLADFTFTRAGDQFGINSGGVLVKSSANNAAFIDGEGVLLEGARTNLAERSNEFDDAAWVKTDGATATADQAIAPDGTLTADLLDISAANSFIIQPHTFTAVPHAYSIWLRAVSGTGTYPINWFDGTHHRVNVNLTTTWQRFEIKFTPLAVGGFIYPGDSRLASTLTTAYAWGAQLEVGSFRSSNITTAGATATRSATSLIRAWPFPANGISGQIKVRPQFDGTDNKGGFVGMLALVDSAGAATNNLELIYNSTSDSILLSKDVGGAGVNATKSGIGYSAGDLLNIRFRASDAGLTLWVNALAKVENTTADAKLDWPSLLDDILVGVRDLGTLPSFQAVESHRIWNEAKSDSFLEALV
jgi:hypothetical protein